jgi:pyruvate dehydrogenase E1 component
MPSDLDPAETREWLDSLDAVLEFDGPDRSCFLLDELIEEARRNGAPVPYWANTPYLNTIPPQLEPRYPGDQEIEHALRSMIRWAGRRPHHPGPRLTTWR